ncbi:HIT domain-containing protein [Mangrovimicrobium sediminis]|uniref:HIT domain-containing protein n=1 Tax=Mangrovimicrobium sediminis TaxID=2562682 RepID=A0A4Z0M8C9_9GAMM|nr:HIT domain-containing protein [Haliea sp. SAOS-164]TGD75791.1 HIT domain-containing protein [Haliea sp. SAOS-164]
MELPDIHPQLLADTHYLGQLPTGSLLLHRNASVPWFILVPETRLEDFLDLPEVHRQAVLADCAAVSAFVKTVLGFAKVNFAGIGNLVPQMHLHVVARAPDDPCWPRPVWGNLEGDAAYSPATLSVWRTTLEHMAGLETAPL